VEASRGGCEVATPVTFNVSLNPVTVLEARPVQRYKFKLRKVIYSVSTQYIEGKVPSPVYETPEPKDPDGRFHRAYNSHMEAFLHSQDNIVRGSFQDPVPLSGNVRILSGSHFVQH
jgi:hypothetical protein